MWCTLSKLYRPIRIYTRLYLNLTILPLEPFNYEMTKHTIQIIVDTLCNILQESIIQQKYEKIITPFA
jgi:hypothetical protein